MREGADNASHSFEPCQSLEKSVIDVLMFTVQIDCMTPGMWVDKHIIKVGSESNVRERDSVELGRDPWTCPGLARRSCHWTEETPRLT